MIERSINEIIPDLRTFPDYKGIAAIWELIAHKIRQDEGRDFDFAEFGEMIGLNGSPDNRGGNVSKFVHGHRVPSGPIQTILRGFIPGLMARYGMDQIPQLSILDSIDEMHYVNDNTMMHDNIMVQHNYWPRFQLLFARIPSRDDSRAQSADYQKKYGITGLTFCGDFAVDLVNPARGMDPYQTIAYNIYLVPVDPVNKKYYAKDLAMALTTARDEIADIWHQEAETGEDYA